MNRNFRSRGGSRNPGGSQYYTKPKVPEKSLSILHDCNYNDTTYYNPLFLAVHNGKLKATHSLLEEGSLECEVSGKKLIHIAAARGHEQIICLLSKRNAEIDKGDKDGNTPLHLAIKENHTDVVNLLLNEATANLTNLRKATPLHVATQMGNLLFVDLLLKGGAKVDEKNEDGKTPLHISAGSPNPDMEIIIVLLIHGASVRASCKKGYTPLHYVTTSGSLLITKVLIDRGASITLEDINGISPFCLAIQKNKTEMVKYILKQKTDVESKIPGQMMPLHFAAETGNEEIVKLLVTEGDAVKVNAKGEGLKTPLHFSAANGHVKVLKYLIQCGAEIDPETKECDTPLHLSAAAGNLEIVCELLERGAKIDSFNTAGFTPLALATKARRKEVVRLLLNKRASATHCRRPYEYLDGCKPADLGRLLLSDLNKLVFSNLDRLLLPNMDVMPPFHLAVKTGDEEIVKIFLKSGVEVDLESKNDKTALHFAATFGHRILVEELIRAGANINSRTMFLETPLHLAAASGRVSTVKYLLNSGAEFQTTCKKYTPLHYALDRERHDALINPKKTSSSFTRRISRLFRPDRDSSKMVLVSPFLFEKYLQITEMLLIKGASSESRTDEGNSPLDYAFRIKVSKEDQSKPLSRSLGKVNASESRIKNEEFRPEIVRCLLNYGAKIRFTSEILDDSSLTKAVKLKCPPLVDVLLEYDINNSFEYTNALDLAQKKGELNIILAIAEQISDIETIVDSLCNFNVSPATASTKLLKEDVSKLLIAILVKMRSTSKISVVKSRELKFLEDEGLLEWYTHCELELMNLRESKIHQQFNVTFYDILTKPVSKVASFTRNKNLMQILVSGCFKEFPAYTLCLERSIEKGKERKYLIESGTECFFSLIRQYCKIQLPSLIVDKIFEYLSVIDLRKLSATIYKKSYHEGASCGFRFVKRK